MIRSDRLADLTAEQQRALLRELLKQRAAEESRFPMSVQQQGLWFDYLRNPTATRYNVFFPARVRSEINTDAMHQSIDLLVRRHACLRTTFSDAGEELVQIVHPDLQPVFEVVDAHGLSDNDVREQVTAHAGQPFDLQDGPLIRLILFRRDKSDWVTLAMTHHIVVDFWSMVLLLSEMRTVYASLVSSRKPVLPSAVSNYASFVKQQRAMLGAERGEKLRQYWRRQLEGSSQVASLPTDFVRPERFTGAAATVSLELGQDITGQMLTLAKSCGTTFQAVVLAVLQTLIHRYTGQVTFQIGSPFAGRLNRDYEHTVGYFVNLLPLRADFSGETTFVDLVNRTGQTLVGALEHEDLPLAEIVREAGTQRETSRSPLFQIVCTFEKSHLQQEQGRAAYLFAAEDKRTNFGGLEQESFPVPPQTCNHDMEFVFERSGDGLQGMICYCRDLFASDTMETVAGHFKVLASLLLQHPSRPLADVAWPVDGFASEDTTQRTRSDAPPQIMESVERVASRTPDQLALLSDDLEQDYASLVASGAAISRSLARRSISRGSFVPVIGKLGPEVVPALLGVIRSGAALVPIDAEQPAVGAGDLIEDTNAGLVIAAGEVTQAGSEWSGSDIDVVSIDHLIGEGPGETVPFDRVRGDDLCYVIYTSGSSGRPKGVMVEHAAIDNTLQWRRETVPVGRDDRVLILLSHQFDAGIGLILSTLVQARPWFGPGIRHRTSTKSLI